MPKGSLAGLEEAVLSHGQLPLADVYRWLGLRPRGVHYLVQQSEVLEIDGDVVRLAPQVDSEYGPVTRKELRQLRALGVPPLAELEERKREARELAAAGKLRTRHGS